MKKRRGKKGKYVIRAKGGLLEDTVWKRTLQGYPIPLVCSIREKLLQRIPGITEKFNSNSRYFGYWTGDDKDRIYIYVQKENLVIDLHIEPSYVSELEKEGFVIKPRDNFQGQAGWLTGWQVPHLTNKIEAVIKWLRKAFEGD